MPGDQRTPAFARDPATARYYEQRAGEYDEWYRGVGRFAQRDRPGWHDELEQLIALIRDLPSARTLDVACGTGFLTQHVTGDVVALDSSRAMIDAFRKRLPYANALVADGLALPFSNHSFERVLTGHFYGHLPPGERAVFLTEARRIAGELVVIDSALRAGVQAEQWQQRTLNDGSHHQVYKRHLTGTQLRHEVAGDVLLGGRWFVAARTRWPAPD